MSQTDWRFRTGGGRVLDEGEWQPTRVVGELLASWQVGGARWLAAVPAPHQRERAQTTWVIGLKAPKKLSRATSPRHGCQLWSVDRESLERRAIFATEGSLESDSAALRRTDQGHRTRPWFRLPLKTA